MDSFARIGMTLPLPSKNSAGTVLDVLLSVI